MRDEPPPGWTRYTLPIHRRVRAEPPPDEPSERGRFSGKKFVLISLMLGLPILLLAIGWLIRIDSR
jgi:hypothetical protein